MHYKFLLLVLAINSMNAMVTVNIDQGRYFSEQLADVFKDKHNAHIITWYNGECGITKEGAEFYKENIFRPIISDNPSIFYLYDLVGWGGLRNKKSSIKTESRVASQVNSLKKDHYKAIHSSDFFKKLVNEQDESIIEYINHTILTRDNIHKNSESHNLTGIQIKDVLNCLALKTIEDMDTARAYSALQYLEGLYLTKHIVESSPDKDIDITFLLPNDESKYYISEDFRTDLSIILNKQLENHNTIKTSFISFNFGNTIKDRP